MTDAVLAELLAKQAITEALALYCRGPGGGDRHKAVHPCCRIVLEPPDLAAIDHDPDPFYGEACFRDIRRQDDLAHRCGHDRPFLLRKRQISIKEMEGDGLFPPRDDILETCCGLADFAGSGQENEDVPRRIP